LPSPFLHALGITYYPDRWWSLAMPAWIVMLLIFIYVALLSYNVEYLTLPLNSLECVVDDAGNVAILDAHGRLMKGGSKRFVKEMDERAKMDREMANARQLRGPNATDGKYSSSKGGGSTDRMHREKGRRRPSRKGSSGHGGPAQDDAEFMSTSNGAAAYSSSHHQSRSYAHDPPTFPFLANGNANRTPTNFHSIYPNWKLIWNEGTDAVMDVPIGGVCEVLYG